MSETLVADRGRFHALGRPSLLCLYMILSSVLYTIVEVHTPIALYAAPFDDELFVTLAMYISGHQWLGPFNELTLAKGTGYPLYLALAHRVGISVSLAHALFHCGTIAFFTVIFRRFTQSALLSAIVFTLLLWNPVTFVEPLLRITREYIYNGQILVVLAALAYAMLGPVENRQRLAYGALAGFFLGWFWLTREEGPWVIPGLAALVLIGVVRAVKRGTWRSVAATLVLGAVVFGATQAAVAVMNYRVYGKFMTVDMKERNYLRAMRAVGSVIVDGQIRPFISVSRAARQEIYRFSPAFASLKDYFEGQGGTNWAEHMCHYDPSTCGEIGSGWFMWAFREGASRTGHYGSPKQASAFFRLVAAEVNAACARGDLTCRPSLIAEMPQVTWRQVVFGIPHSFVGMLDPLLFLTRPALDARSSSGSEEPFKMRLKFLRYPLHTRSVDIPAEIRGWYHKTGADWLDLKIMDPAGRDTEAKPVRSASPDVAQRFNDPLAANQRFSIPTLCGDECMLRVTANGASTDIKLIELRRGAFSAPVGGGELHLDELDPMYTISWLETASRSLRAIILSAHPALSIAVAVIGMVAFAISIILLWRVRAFTACFAVALAAWLLFLGRMGLVSLIDATANPIIKHHYVSPAIFTLICASLLSVGAAREALGLSRSDPNTV